MRFGQFFIKFCCLSQKYCLNLFFCGAINNIPLKVKQTRDYAKRYKRKKRAEALLRHGNEKGLIGSSLLLMPLAGKLET